MIATLNLRENILTNAKTFKTSWVYLGQALFSVWRDKAHLPWGYDKFEDYTAKELGLNKTVALKLIKTYFFVESHEPEYLKAEFAAGRDAAIIPSYEPLDILRRARQDKNLTREDYSTLRDKVFKKGTDVGELRKDLTQMIKERKKIDPQAERDKRYEKSVKKFTGALKEFTRDMDALNPGETFIIEQAQSLLENVQALAV